MKETYVKAILVTMLMAATAAVGAVSRAQEPPKAKPAEAVQEKTDPALAEKIRGLIRQLGDDKYAKRQEASAALKDIGRPTVPLLTEAQTKSDDPEIRNRAETILGEIVSGSTQKLLDTLVIPEVNLPNGTLGALLEFMTKESQRLDEQHLGIAFKASQPAYANVPLTALKLKNVKLADLLKTALATRGITYAIGGDGSVVVGPTQPSLRRIRPRPVEEE